MNPADIRVEQTYGIAFLYGESEAGYEWLTEEYGMPAALDDSWALETQYVADMVRVAEGDGLVVSFDNLGGVENES